jgi:hypothetical protein
MRTSPVVMGELSSPPTYIWPRVSVATQVTIKPDGRVRVEDGATGPLAVAENCRMEEPFPLRGCSTT